MFGVVLLAFSAAVGFGIGALVAVAAWLTVLALLAAATHPRVPRAGAPTMDLGGEPPALAGFLVDGWHIDGDAPAATLVDLAARGHVSFDRITPTEALVRFSNKASSDTLNDYEKMVLDRARAMAHGSPTVPCSALADDNVATATAWRTRFDRAVIAQARAEGLSRARFTPAMTTLLTILAGGVGVLVAAAIVTAPTKGTSSSNDNPVAAFIGIALIVTVGLMALVSKLRAERDTDSGRAAAARWLGVDRFLGADGAFADLGPDAVVVRGRHLAYATSFGLAPGITRAVAFGANNPKVAWSMYGGLWHRLRVDLPGRFEPRWGTPPSKVLLGGIVRLLAGLALVAVTGRIIVAIVSAITKASFANNGPWWLPFAILAVVAVVALTPSRAVYHSLVVGALLTYRALADQRAPTHARGEIVRVETWPVSAEQSQRYLVLDPGGGARVARAWALPADAHNVGVGSVVDVVVHNRMRAIESIVPVTPAPS